MKTLVWRRADFQRGVRITRVYCATIVDTRFLCDEAERKNKLVNSFVGRWLRRRCWAALGA
jgi:hypothetical protein